MNYSCQEEYDQAMQWQAEYEAEMEAQQAEAEAEAESELSCCGTRITDTWLCVECWEHC